jgi:hypothetical protein
LAEIILKRLEECWSGKAIQRRKNEDRMQERERRVKRQYSGHDPDECESFR